MDRVNQEKLYIQLTRIFTEEICSGKWQLKHQIPTEEELCRKYDVSKITVRQAVNNLVSEGYLVKRQGKGTFVTSVLPMVGLVAKTRLTEEMFGREVMVERLILFKGMREPSSSVKNYLKTEGKVYYVFNKRVVNSETAYVEESFVPYRQLPGIEKLDVGRGPLYSLLQGKGIKKIFKVMQTVEISEADGEIAGNLELKKGTPVLVVHRLFLSSDNTPVAYVKLQGRSDRYKFQTEFERIR